jgi:hypothetical protein
VSFFNSHGVEHAPSPASKHEKLAHLPDYQVKAECYTLRLTLLKDSFLSRSRRYHDRDQAAQYSSTSTTDTMTPFELFTGHKARISSFYFGQLGLFFLSREWCSSFKLWYLPRHRIQRQVHQRLPWQQLCLLYAAIQTSSFGYSSCHLELPSPSSSSCIPSPRPY